MTEYGIFKIYQNCEKPSGRIYIHAGGVAFPLPPGGRCTAISLFIPKCETLHGLV